MTYVVGIRGPDQMRWCACGDHLLEITGLYGTSRRNEDGSAVYEYSHVALCPVCQDKERRGEPFGASLGGVRGEAPGSPPRVAEDALRPS